MKRDIELVRKILETVKECETFNRPENITIDGYKPMLIHYHIKLLGEAGYLEVSDYSTKAGPNFMINGMTWQGHEFLDTIRNETVWKKLTIRFKEDAGKLPFEVIKVIGATLIKGL